VLKSFLSADDAPWRLPFRRVLFELQSASRRLELAREVIEAGERFLVLGRVENAAHEQALRPTVKVLGWLCLAGDAVGRANEALKEAFDLVCQHPEDALGAMAALNAAAYDLTMLMAKAADLSGRTEQMSVTFLAARAPGGQFEHVVPVYDPEPIRRVRIAVAPPVTHPRHRRSLGNYVSATRRVFRGRAPPALSFPTL